LEEVMDLEVAVDLEAEKGQADLELADMEVLEAVDLEEVAAEFTEEAVV
jgi:hypothetical protein